MNLPERAFSNPTHIAYHMVGPFGGYGSSTQVEAGEKRYAIDAAYEGAAASDIKVIAWIPGCEIVTLEVSMQQQDVERVVSCKPVASVQFKGQVPAALLAALVKSSKPLEVTVDYLAFWSHRFFGICDGPVAEFRIGTASPKEDGTFEFVLPNLAQQGGLGEADFTFVLREQGNGNTRAFLHPKVDGSETHNLKVLPRYAGIIQFDAEPVLTVAN